MENALWAVKLIFIWVSIKLTWEENKKQRKKYGEKKKITSSGGLHQFKWTFFIILILFVIEKERETVIHLYTHSKYRHDNRKKSKTIDTQAHIEINIPKLRLYTIINKTQQID